ncbi:MAG: hypothetical protein LBV29_01650 [Azoarcus sp.]|jgi:hypothetical protein|nr:hypothetical protein [Azoarcus sp.]
MSANLDRARILQGKISEVLLKNWDPIGVCSIPEAQDEYDSYVSSVHKLLISGKPESEIFDYLWWVETEHMGLIGDRQKTAAIAKKLWEMGVSAKN